MTAHPASPARWSWPLNPMAYDRRPALTDAERSEMDKLVNRRKKSPQLFEQGAVVDIPLDHPLQRLLRPIIDVWQVAGVDRQELTDGVGFLIEEMQRRQLTYWAWTKADWIALISINFFTFRDQYHKSKACRLFLVLFSYLLIEITDLRLLSQTSVTLLARRIFPLRIEEAIHQVCGELTHWGYTKYRVDGRFTNALCLLLLAQHSPYPSDLSTALLEQVRRSSVSSYLKEQLFALSRVLVKLGCIEQTLEKEIYQDRGGCYRDKLEGVPDVWNYWCQRWVKTSTLTLKTRRSSFRNLIKAGRWVATTHPDQVDPANWTRELAAEFVAAVDQMKIGDWCHQGKLIHSTVRPIGQSLKATSKAKIIGCVRTFFNDAQAWGWLARRFDPYRCLATPRSMQALIGPDPRIIADDIWAKLLWAGLNLTDKDFPAANFTLGKIGRQSFYPTQLTRSLSIVWLFAGLRCGEIRRLRVGCVRWQREAVLVSATNEMLPADKVCWLDIPVHKTGSAFTKAVDRVVGEAIAAWERVRPTQQPALLDGKTNEVVDLLYSFRGHGLGSGYINDTLIPLLCRKAGVPRSDARGSITSHRARSTIASQLYNAKEPLSLFDLQEWLGHRLPSSTQHYAKLSPTKVAKAYEKAGYFDRNLRTIEVLIDQQAVQSGAAASGKPWKYYDLGHGYCTYDFFDQCAHRMACAKCSFYRPKASSEAQLVEGKKNLQRMLQEIPLLYDERAAVEDGVEAMDKLLKRLATIPTPVGGNSNE